MHQSDSVLVASVLRYSQYVRLGQLHLVIQNPEGLSSNLWFGFHLSGEAFIGQTEIVGSSEKLTRSRRPQRISVYICSERALSGVLDTVRARLMVSSYEQVC
jgi:hypothetical protein